MFILKVTTKSGVQQSDFATREECESHLANTYWGKEAYTEIIPEHQAIDVEAWTEVIPEKTVEEIIPKQILTHDAYDEVIPEKTEKIIISPYEEIQHKGYYETIPAHEVDGVEVPEKTIFHDEYVEIKEEVEEIIPGYIKTTVIPEEIIYHPPTLKTVAEQVIEHEVEYTYEIIEVKDTIPSISPRQIRLALLAAGLTESSIDKAISNLPSPMKDMAMIAWKYSTYFERESEAVSNIGVILGLDESALDALWLMGKDL